MADKETTGSEQAKTDTDITVKNDAVKNEEKKDNVIPYERFKEVNDQLKELKEFKSKYEAEKAEAEKQKAIDTGKMEEYYKLQLEQKETLLKQKEKEIFDERKEKLLEKFTIPASMKKYITGETLEEIERSATEMQAELEKDGVIKKKEELAEKLDGSKKEKEKTTTDKIFTKQEVAELSKNPEEYKKNRVAILEQMAKGLIK